MLAPLQLAAAHFRGVIAQVLGTAAAAAVALIIAVSIRGSRKDIKALKEKDLVLFPVWRGIYVLGALLAAFGLFAFGFGLFATQTAVQAWIACTGGTGLAALGLFNIYVTKASYILIARDWVEVKDVWRIRRFEFADLKRPNRSGSGFRLDNGSKQLYLGRVYANSNALLELLEQRWIEAHESKEHP